MFISEDELADRIGRDRVNQLFDRDLDNEPDQVPLSAAITDANAEIWARLRRKGYSDDQLKELSRDETIRRAAANIVAEFGAYGKPELIGDNGETYYTKLANNSRKLIDDIAMATFRPRAEQTAGAPSNVQAITSAPCPEFYVAPSEDRPRGRGMF